MSRTAICSTCRAPLGLCRGAHLLDANRLAPIAEVYERYKHLDRLLSDAAMMPDSDIGRTLWALWAAVKRAMEEADA